MGRNLKTYDEKYRLITQCRQSGLADASWCRQNGIASSTFYSWVSQLRNIGYAIPDSENKEKCMPAQPQEVVKIELVPEENTSVPVCRSEMPAPESPSIRIDISGVCRFIIKTDPGLTFRIDPPPAGFRTENLF